MTDWRAFNQQRYEALWRELNTRLHGIQDRDGLGAALLALERQQFDAGFIQDDLRAVVRWRIRRRADHTRAFTVQYNPKRAERHQGAGRRTPPQGVRPVNRGCFICKENIAWQQLGLEVGLDYRTADGRPFVFWMNPFPLMPTHTTVASAAHRPQSWVGPTEAETEANVTSLLSDLIEMSGQLPGFVGFYNGPDAGASIPHHFHFQFFKRRFDLERFPLEVATDTGPRRTARVLRVHEYPISAIAFHAATPADRARVLEQAKRCLIAWAHFYEDSAEQITANVIVTMDGDDASLDLYVIPRHRQFSRAPGMVGLVAGLEILGELVYSHEEERLQIERGDIDYESVSQTIAAVEPPRIEKYLSQVEAMLKAKG